MNYILVTDSNNKVIIFEENKMNLLYKFLKDNPLKIDQKNYFTEEELTKFKRYRHIANCDKTDDEFKEYKIMSQRVGLPEPKRDSKIRPLHEK